MNQENAINTLNALIEINNDRIEGYETASKETEDMDLKSLFQKLIQTSHTCKQALVAEVEKLGGTVVEGTRITGKFFRVWMDVKAALTGNDRKAILNSCEYGEDVAQDVYENNLEEDADALTEEQFVMIRKQKTMLKADHDTIKSMRDMVK